MILNILCNIAEVEGEKTAQKKRRLSPCASGFTTNHNSPWEVCTYIVRPQWKLLLTHILFRGGDSEAIELNTLFICAKAQYKCKNYFQFNYIIHNIFD